ncbi:MAG: imidazoleglycerol-phosphate dehydratase HisB [Fusobacteriota bacterium]
MNKNEMIKRESIIKRKTNETNIDLKINIDGSGNSKIITNVGFLDHMLELFSRHGNFDLDCKADGDIQVDFHHITEDIGITLGLAIREALGDKKGINRYGTSYVPMMETLTRTSLDLSGRGFLNFNHDFKYGKVGDFDTELVEEFFYSVAYNGGINMHLDLIRGKNIHHIIESFFKSFARALDKATQVTGDRILSTKGII